MTSKTSIITTFLFLLSHFVFCQKSIEGIVFDAKDEKPIPFAKVYINNSTIGVLSDENGKFKLKNIFSNEINLIVSYVGYKTYSQKIKPDTLSKALSLFLEEDLITLKPLIVRQLKNGYERYFPLFLEHFIGNTQFSDQCKLKKPKDLIFILSDDGQELTIKSNKSLKIDNKALGYIVKYDLEEFTYNFRTSYVSYFGYGFFEEKKGTKSRDEKFIANRKKAYLGSSQHYLKTLINGNSQTEGFKTYQLKRINKKTQQVNTASENRDSLGNIIPSKLFFWKKLADSSLLKIETNDSLKRIQSPTYSNSIQYIYKTPLKDSSLIQVSNNEFYLDFNDLIYIVYDKEKEEPRFNPNKGKNLPQVSIVSLIDRTILVNKNGYLADPLSVIYEGRWAQEKMGELLPIDYLP